MKFVVGFLFLMSMFFTSSSQIVKLHEQLRVKGTRLVDAKDKDVALHGMSFGWHNWWPRFYNADAVHELATKWNCTVIRAAMGIEPDSGYLKNPKRSLELTTNAFHSL